MKVAFSFLALGMSLTVSGLAGAQEYAPSSPPVTVPDAPTAQAGRAVTAPSNAFELTFGTGYTQGFGNLQSGVGMPSVVTPGIGVDVGAGYRVSPRIAVNFAGQYAELTGERARLARTFTGGVAMQYHLAPGQKVDPWLEAGAGYRVLFEDPTSGPNLVTHGLQLGRVRAGLDFAEEGFAIGPVIGADATLFLFQDVPNVQTNIADPTVSTFVYAGIQGRFDFGGRTTRTNIATASAH